MERFDSLARTRARPRALSWGKITLQPRKCAEGRPFQRLGLFPWNGHTSPLAAV